MTKTDIPGIYKDESSGALINKDNASLLAYKKRKESDRRLDIMENRLNELQIKLDKLINSINTIISENK